MGTQVAFSYDLLQLISDEEFEQIVELSQWSQQDIEETLKLIIKVGYDSVSAVIEATSKEKKERSKERNENIISQYINKNNKRITNSPDITLSEILPPLEAKTKAKKSARSKPKRKMPAQWIQDRDNETINDQALIDYAETKGYDWYQAKELFIDFVDYNLKKGKVFADWNRAWYTWLRNDTKWNGPPKDKKLLCSDNVLKSYKTLNPKEVFSR